MNPRIWTLDLEMNQPSRSIIQIGAVIGDIGTGAIIEQLDIKVNANETLNPNIIELTGLTQVQVDNGIPLVDAVAQLEGIIGSRKACKSPFVWGNGDLRTLKAQSQGEKAGLIQGIFREVDLKTLHQAISLAKGRSMRGGLEKSMESYGLKFVGRAHDALVDAKNTFYLACYFHKQLATIP